MGGGGWIHARREKRLASSHLSNAPHPPQKKNSKERGKRKLVRCFGYTSNKTLGGHIGKPLRNTRKMGGRVLETSVGTSTKTPRTKIKMTS